MNTKRRNCVVCNSALHDDVVDIGEQYPSAIYPKIDANYGDLIQKTSLNVTQCTKPECRLVQLSHTYNLDLVFKHYPYVSGSTATMNQILQDIVTEAESLVDLSATDVVLDIGGNDGTMLSKISTKVKARVNIDAASGIDSVVSSPDYRRVEAKFSFKEYQKQDLPNPKLIFSVAMFYHLDNPVAFCEDVKAIMNYDSVWCLQMTYLGTMLSNDIYDNIVHEHVTYYSLKSLEYLLDKIGLEVFHARIVESYGGSIRAFIQKKSSTKRSASQELINLRNQETITNLNSLEALQRFNERTQILKDVTFNWITNLTQKHGPLTAFGASTKGNMICQFLGLNKSHISAVLDNNDKKVGSILVGSNIPIINESENFKNMSEYVVVLPYYYTNFFEKLLNNLKDKGRAEYLFVPLPRPRAIKLVGSKT